MKDVNGYFLTTIRKNEIFFSNSLLFLLSPFIHSSNIKKKHHNKTD